MLGPQGMHHTGIKILQVIVKAAQDAHNETFPLNVEISLLAIASQVPCDVRTVKRHLPSLRKNRVIATTREVTNQPYRFIVYPDALLLLEIER